MASTKPMKKPVQLVSKEENYTFSSIVLTSHLVKGEFSTFLHDIIIPSPQAFFCVTHTQLNIAYYAIQGLIPFWNPQIFKGAN